MDDSLLKPADDFSSLREQAEVLEQTDAKLSKSESAALKSILTKYYRLPLPHTLDVYRNFLEQPVNVRMAIQNDPFWNKVGRYIQVLDFSEQERLKFARDSECENLMVFLLFEKNLEVLEAVFNNPRLPTKVLLDYVNLIKERDIDREDDKILKAAQRVMKRRSRRIVKAREIHGLAFQSLSLENAAVLFCFMIDEDPQIRQAAANVISMMSVKFLQKILRSDDFDEFMRKRQPTLLGNEFFDILHAAVKIILTSKDTSKMMEEEEEIEIEADLNEDLRTLKLRTLEKSKDDPSDFFNLSVIVYMHLAEDEAMSAVAQDVLSLEDVFDLLSDESTPRHVSVTILRLLEKHPNKQIQTRAQEIRIKDAERLNKKMKEIEVSVNAYFDVIFQSLNYNKINNEKEAVQNLRTALNYLQQFSQEAEDLEPSAVTVTQGVIRKAIEHFDHSISHLYGDTKKEVFSEIEEIQGMVQHILDLKNFKFEEENKKPDDVDEEILNKAVMIWRATISVFLGRVKDLEEMLRMKWTKLISEGNTKQKIESIESELYEAFDEIESGHKAEVECKLKIPCRECKRRGCASERFLHQVDFLLDEINMNFGKAKTPEHVR